MKKETTHIINEQCFDTIEKLNTYLKSIKQKAVIHEIVKLNNGNRIIYYQLIGNPWNS